MAISFVQMHRRNHRSWPAIVERMSPVNRLAWSGEANGSSEKAVSTWIESPWTAFRDAGVLMEMTDYAERNAASFDLGRLQAIRLAAIQLRFAAAAAIVRNACSL